MGTGLYVAREAEGLGAFAKAEDEIGKRKRRRAFLFARSSVEMIRGFGFCLVWLETEICD